MTEPRATDVDGTAEAAAGWRDEAPPGVPLWVKLLGIALLIVILVFGGLHLTGHGMGPGAHLGHLSGHSTL